MIVAFKCHRNIFAKLFRARLTEYVSYSLSEKRGDVFMDMCRDAFKYFYFIRFNLLVVTLKIQRTPLTVTRR